MSLQIDQLEFLFETGQNDFIDLFTIAKTLEIPEIARDLVNLRKLEEKYQGTPDPEVMFRLMRYSR